MFAGMGGAASAGFQVGKGGIQFPLQHLQTLQLGPSFLQLAAVEGPEFAHQGGSVGIPLVHPVQKGFDVREGEAQFLQTGDPVDPDQGVFVVESKTALGPSRRLQQPQFLVKMKGTHGAPALFGEFPDTKGPKHLLRRRLQGGTVQAVFGPVLRQQSHPKPHAYVRVIVRRGGARQLSSGRRGRIGGRGYGKLPPPLQMR